MKARKIPAILYDENEPSADRLRAMIKALASDSPIDESMRMEIMRTLKSFETKQRNDELRGKGRGIALYTFQAAALAKELIDNFKIKPQKAAILAAFESVKERMGLADEITHGAVARTYGKIKGSTDCSMITGKGDKFVLASISQGFIDDALSRIQKHDCRIAKPPFVIAVAHLSKPTESGNK